MRAQVAPGEERGAGVGDHAKHGHSEATVEFEEREASKEMFGCGFRRRSWIALVIYLGDGSSDGRSRRCCRYSSTRC